MISGWRQLLTSVELDSIKQLKLSYPQDDWLIFVSWASRNGMLFEVPTPAETVLAFISYLEQCGNSYSTIEKRCHGLAAYNSRRGTARLTRLDCIRTALAELRVRLAARKHKAAIDSLSARELVAGRLLGSDSAIAWRDISVLTLGSALGAKPGALVALNLADIKFKVDRVLVRISRAGRKRWVPVFAKADDVLCSVHALRRYLGVYGDGSFVGEIGHVPLFRPCTKHGTYRSGRLSVQSLGLILKRMCLLIDLDPDIISGSSIRLGKIYDIASACGPGSGVLAKAVGYRSTTHVVRLIKSSPRLLRTGS